MATIILTEHEKAIIEALDSLRGSVMETGKLLERAADASEKEVRAALRDAGIGFHHIGRKIEHLGEVAKSEMRRRAVGP